MSDSSSAAGASRLDEFEAYRTRMNRRILEEKDHLGMKRFFALDSAAYRDGGLDARTKELLGLVASLVLRCNDCVDYHLIQCVDAGFGDEQIDDALNVGLVVGGSIVIPHLRHAVDTLDALRARGT
jgi:AhpD family alkylhydroperoxidase